MEIANFSTFTTILFEVFSTDVAMLFANKQSIRDVMAFPKTSSGLSLMDDSPSQVDESQLKDLHIKTR